MGVNKSTRIKCFGSSTAKPCIHSCPFLLTLSPSSPPASLCPRSLARHFGVREFCLAVAEKALFDFCVPPPPPRECQEGNRRKKEGRMASAASSAPPPPPPPLGTPPLITEDKCSTHSVSPRPSYAEASPAGGEGGEKEEEGEERQDLAAEDPDAPNAGRDDCRRSTLLSGHRS